MKVGIPLEVGASENRVAATPKTVQRLIKQGFEVFVEKDAGKKALFSDQDYIDAGGRILESVFEQVDIVLKVLPPSENEVGSMKPGTMLASYLWPAQNSDLLNLLAQKKINAVAMDAIPRISRAQKMDVLSSMANIAGYRAVVESANYFGRFMNGQITAAGKVDPAKVLVIGAGVAGLAAIGAAKNLGAIVKAFDTRKEVREQIQSMGAEFITVNIDEDGSTASGYSKEMSQAFIDAEMSLFRKEAKEVDIIITTAQIPGKTAPKLILKDMVESMKMGSVIVDLAATTGGNCELTKPGEVYVYNGVTIIGKLDQLASQASWLYGNNLCHLLDDMGKNDQFKIDMNDDIVGRAMVVYDGKINWPPKPLSVSASSSVIKEKTQPQSNSLKVQEVHRGKNVISSVLGLGIIAALLFIIGQFAPKEFLSHFTVFILSCFVGWQVVWNVSHSLHTPLMSVTNAISGIIIIGGILHVKENLLSPISLLALVAVFIATINVAGGFFITHRMLKMFRR